MKEQRNLYSGSQDVVELNCSFLIENVFLVWSKVISGSLFSRHLLPSAGPLQLYFHPPFATVQVCLFHWNFIHLTYKPCHSQQVFISLLSGMCLNLKLHHLSIVPHHLQINRIVVLSLNSFLGIFIEQNFPGHQVPLNENSSSTRIRSLLGKHL